MNTTKLSSVNYPVAVSKYMTAYEFEIIDLPKVVYTMRGYTQWVIILCLAYVASVFALQAWMKNRRAFELKNPLILWNFGLAVFSVIGLSRQIPEAFGIWKDFGFHDVMCSPNHHNYAVSYWQLIFTLSKVVEFGDTYFLVLRKKKVIFLHWFHHASILFFSWVTFIEEDIGVRRGGLINYLVHSFMYTYFALRAMNFKFPVWLAKSITSMQIAQFVFVTYLSSYSIFARLTDKGCSRPWRNDIYVFGSAIVYLSLFIKFFRDNYSQRKTIKKEK